MIAVTTTPPSEAKACVLPNAISFWRLSGNSSASHVIAATNSTQTPMKVVQRKNTNDARLVLKAAAHGESAYTRMLAAMIVLRPNRSISQPPSSPNTPPHKAVSHSKLPIH